MLEKEALKRLSQEKSEMAGTSSAFLQRTKELFSLCLMRLKDFFSLQEPKTPLKGRQKRPKKLTPSFVDLALPRGVQKSKRAGLISHSLCSKKRPAELRPLKQPTSSP